MKKTVLAASLMTLALSAAAGEIKTRVGNPSRQAHIQQTPSGSRAAGVSTSRAPSFGSRIAPSPVSFGRASGRRLAAQPAPASNPAPQDPQTPNGPAPQFGALVQTAHPTKIGPETPQFFAVVDGGSDFMHPEADKSRFINPFPGVRMGKADSPPSANSGGASGKNGISAIPNPGESQ